MVSLPDLFRDRDPLPIQHDRRPTRREHSSTSTTRSPTSLSDEVFSRLPDHTLTLTHSPSILDELLQLVNESWTVQTTLEDIGSTWDMKLRLDAHYCQNSYVHNEVVGLSGVFNHHLFSPVNFVAARSSGYLKPEAYPPQPLVAAFGRPVKWQIAAGHPDDCATLRPAGESSVSESKNMVIIEKKGPWLDGLWITKGVKTAAQKPEGFKIVKVDPAGRYRTDESIELGFRDELIQVSLFLNSHDLGPPAQIPCPLAELTRLVLDIRVHGHRPSRPGCPYQLQRLHPPRPQRSRGHCHVLARHL